MINNKVLKKYIDKVQKNDNLRYPLIVVLGPTAVGKTDLSLNMAENLNAEIISADSMQIYKEMNIGTAKVSKKIRNKIPHHMIDVIKPDQNFSVADYQEYIDNLIPKIINKGKIPLMVGGTGLYINAVVDGFMLPDMEPDYNLRKDLRQKSKKHGNEYVHDILKEIDPPLAEKLHPNDLRRVIRGIEIYRITGKTKTYYKDKQEKKKERYKTIKIGLKREREELYHRINERVEKMIEKGLIEEVKYLKNKYNLSKTAAQALGYKEIMSYLNDEYDINEAKRIIKRDSRHYAKKQLSFFKRDKKINWFNLSKTKQSKILNEIFKLINKKFKV